MFMANHLVRFVYALDYLHRPPWDSGIPAPELVRAIADRPPGKAIDLGCGTGTNVRYLAEQGWQATGVDFIPRAIANARRKTKGLPVTLLVGDVTRLERLDVQGPFDLALDMGCYHSLPGAGRSGYLRGLKKWLIAGGLYMLYAWQPAPERPGRGIPREEVITAFSEGFHASGYEQGTGVPSAWYYFTRD
jgi:SAM-dependent methyltransferase